MRTDTDSPQPPPDIFFVPRIENVAQAFFAGLVAFMCLMVGVIGNWPDDALTIFWGVVTAVLVGLGVRCWRRAIIARPDQLVVRNYFYTVRINWQDITHFEPPPPFEPPFGWVRKAGLRIHLTDGRVIPASAFMHDRHVDATPETVLRKLARLQRLRTGDPRAPTDSHRNPAPD